jgi:ubiquinone/menaquinone biosynthesis C-methylase UbiE
MGAAAHLGIRTGEYDARIRTFIPFYEEILEAAAGALAIAVTARWPLPKARPGSPKRLRRDGGPGSPKRLRRDGGPFVVDLGIGSGALAAKCLAALPRRTRVLGIDSDAAMLAMARRRLRHGVELVEGDFLDTPIPACDAITASFAVHHVSTAAAKGRLYRRLFRALRRGGALINADCCLATSARARAADRAVWLRHLARRYGARRAEGFLRAWAKEDVYLPLAVEIALMQRAGFVVDVAWRRASFAVVVGTNVAP